MSPGPMTQKETVTFMVEKQEDFRVRVQQDLPLHPLPMQNFTIHPCAFQWDLQCPWHSVSKRFLEPGISEQLGMQMTAFRHVLAV